jgi:glutamyl/glutaminyl-tRNA synthetase
VRAPDGGWRYPNTCRNAPLPTGGWRAATTPLRIRLDDENVIINDQSGVPITQNPALEMGDPVALRRDGAFAYHLAAVVDDGLAEVNRIVRGRDLAPSTPTHWQVQTLLGYHHPTYRHHLLFLEKNAQKLAKFHGSVGTPELRRHYSPEQLCGFLACAVGLLSAPQDVSPSDLLPGFSWNKVAKEDMVIQWDGSQLVKEG